MIAISIFTLGNLLCGFAKNFEQLIAFRVVAGLGGGGINVLVLIIMSDIVSLKERGKVSSSIAYLIIVPSIRWCWCCDGRRAGTVPGRCIYRESHCIRPSITF
jgi:hypothetical protein